MRPTISATMILVVFASLVSAQNAGKAIEAYNEGLRLQQSGDVVNAAKAYDRALALDPKMVDAYNNRANIRLANGDAAGAIADLSKVIEITPKHALSFYNRGNIHLEAQNYDAAIKDFTSAITILDGVTNSYDRRAHAMSYNKRGNALSAKGDFKAAMPDYDRSLTILPKSLEGLTSRGAALQQLGEHKAAVADYTLALEIAPTNTLVLYNRASALEEVDKNAAISDYSRLIALAPDHANAYARRGLMYLELKMKQAAAADLRKAISIDPSLKADYGEHLTLALSK